jgi:hypothetical protein
MRVDEKVNTTCPCGRNVTVGYTDQGEPTVLHEMPMCDDFASRDILAYVRWLRRKTVGYAPGEDS